MKSYEITLLLSPELPEGLVQQTLSEIASSLQGIGGLVQAQGVIGKRNLPSPIKNYKEAYLASLVATLAPEEMPAFAKKLGQFKDVLRSLCMVKHQRPVRTRTPSLRSLSQAPPREIAGEKKMELSEIDKKIDEMIEKPQENI